jgi:DNA replication protein DnaC
MNLVELRRSLTTLRLGGMAQSIEARILQAQSEKLAPIDFVSVLVNDELMRRSDRFILRRVKQAEFRDPNKTLESFDFDFNKKMNRRLVFELATGQFVDKHEDALFLGPPGSGKSHVAQAIGRGVIQTQGHRVLYREAHHLLEELADAAVSGDRKELMERLTTVPLLIIDDLGMRKLPATAAEDLLELVMRRYERGSTLLTSNRPVDDWGKLLGDTAAVAALLDRLLHHAHVAKFGPRSWRTKDLKSGDATE